MQRQDLADAEDEYNDLRAAFDAFKVSYKAISNDQFRSIL